MEADGSGSPKSGLPRPRGDGPLISLLLVWIVVISPPARGWSPFGQLVQPREQGFPARAGMVPACTTAVAVDGLQRFPRPRGDGPSMKAGAAAIDATGFPARAGMVPIRCLLAVRRHTGFPARAGMVPAHLRANAQRSCTTVSPPRAGMVPCTAMLPGRSERGGFPARAGMVPASGHVSRRTAGWSVSPPARGWSPRPRSCFWSAHPGFPAGAATVPARTRLRDGTTVGFPARAGVVPYNNRLSPVQPDFPARAAMVPSAGMAAPPW